MKTHQKQHGGVSFLTLSTIAAIALGGGYYYVDTKADTRAQQAVEKFVAEATSKGANVSYGSVDASPLFRSLTISDFVIKGSDTEADINIGTIKVAGFSLSELNQDYEKVPTKLCLSIDNASVYLKPSMVENDRDMKPFVEILGEKIEFSSKFSYQLDEESGDLSISSTETVVNNFSLNTEITLGNMAWIAELETDGNNENAGKSLGDITLNALSIQFNNTGVVDNVFAAAIKETGQTKAELTKQLLAELESTQGQVTSELEEGREELETKVLTSIILPSIDELINFVNKPEKLQLTLSPTRPITGEDLMMVMFMGKSKAIELLDIATPVVKAN
ncbi:MAG: hypothetical protein COA90_01710 [Gammaproteobacteria bacterium]|nr:MAG: hypothetical protein COA90_01710 [Gammaproteobacteria bacterium]